MFSSGPPIRSLTAATLLLPALLGGCRRSGSTVVNRLAILPVENLSGEPSADWIAQAVPGVISSQLAPSPDVRAFAAAALRDAYAARARQALHGTLVSAGGRLRLSCVVEDLETHRMVRSMVFTGSGKGGVLALLDQASRALSSTVRPFPTQSEEAVRLAATARDPAGCERAVTVDPDFGQAYLAWARWLAGRGGREEALKVLGAAQARRERIAPIERSEIAIMTATLTGDNALRVRSLADLAALTPSDAQPARALGQLEFAAWSFEPALTWFRRAITIEPDTAELRNMLAYAQAYAGNFDDARKSLAEYARLAPDDPNSEDSFGEIEFLAGNFPAAEKHFLAASGMNTAWRDGGPLLKAAHARVMTGDVSGADGLAGRYFELRKTYQDPLIPYRQAQWEFTTGRRRQAIDRMEAFRAAASGDAAARAAAQLAAWKVQMGDRAGARGSALEAEKLASSPQTRTLAAVTRFVTEPPAEAGEWAVRAERTFDRPGDHLVKQHALVYALLLDRHFREASVLLKQVLRQTLPSLAGDLRTLTAWALFESNQAAEARPLASIYPVPEAQSESIFRALAMPRMLLLRASVFDQDGRKEQATSLRTVYEKLKGDVPDAR